jgi:hypothetical protein
MSKPFEKRMMRVGEDIAATMLFPALPDAAFITGQALAADVDRVAP